MIHLDTSFLIRALARDSPEDRDLRARLARAEPLGMSVIAWTEFLCGPVEASQVELVLRIVREPIAFIDEDAATAARLFNQAGRRRGSLTDCMIAATAIRAEAPLATANPKDFRPLEALGLRVLAS